MDSTTSLTSINIIAKITPAPLASLIMSVKALVRFSTTAMAIEPTKPAMLKMATTTPAKNCTRIAGENVRRVVHEYTQNLTY
ncbi:hypothetical protein E2C01_004645 [Portunus trituberculatus]|uniref:Uncharacterized protein n=1 Tax=Portunus trituberculatus TaxID=210409 RepID=A0A5B7CR38_PORTR|nr:hypothetical protein [Portunus trituberculatus]